MRVATAEQMREIDRRAVEEFGMPSLLLMENAGAAVARQALAMARDGDEPAGAAGSGCAFLVFCGPGNNGGDGFVAARHLHNRGHAVTCVLAGARGSVRGDARVNLDLAERLGVPVLPLAEVTPQHLDGPDVIIDALLGTGARGAPRGVIQEAIGWLAHSQAPILSVDVPSGLNADTGEAAGECVEPDHIITFGAAKPAYVEPLCRSLGLVTVADISLPHPLLEGDPHLPEWLTATSVVGSWCLRSPEAHKGTDGRLLVVGGSPGLTGAPALCADGALRIGAGLVTVATPQALNPILEVKLTEAMTLPLPEAEDGGHGPGGLPLLEPWLRAEGPPTRLVLGPGLGRGAGAGELARGLLAVPGPWLAVVDADALNLLAPADEHTFPRLPDGEPRCVITPHPGEMARLLGTDVEAVQSNRLETAREAAGRWGCVVVLKGPATVIAAPDGRAAFNSTGGPALATGGTGDVLAGMIGALLGPCDPYEAACAAVFTHGVAGEIAGTTHGAPGAVAGDVVAAIPEALRRLRAGEIPPPCRTI